MLNPGMFVADRYEIIDKVGSGGMADVYKARCHKLNRFVAIKVLKPEFSNDRTFVAKFRAEAQSAAGLSHPNIVGVYDVGEENGMHYIVMELIDGITLKNFIERKGHLDFRETVGITIQIAQGLEAAHNNGIIHRDIKPQNIMISKDGKVKVADFGIAKAATSNTLTSNAMGSVHYISPEQARGGFNNEKSDIYSLGITMYEMVAGRVPFEGDNAVSIALSHIQSEAITLGELLPGVPVSLDRIVQKCMQKKSERRYRSVAELIADLKHAIMEPNVDFIVIPESYTDESPTISLSQNDVNAIRNGSMPPNNYDDPRGYNNGYNNYNGPGGPNGPMGQGGPNNMPMNRPNGPMGQGGPNGQNGPNGPGMGGQNGYNNYNDRYNNGYDNYDDYDDEYYNEGEEMDEETVDPKVEKIAVGAAIACVVGIVILVIVILVKVFGSGNDDDGRVTPAPTASQAAEQTALPGAKMVDVPNVIERTSSMAQEMIESNNLVYKMVEEASNEIKEGYVIRTEPNVGEEVAEGTIISVYVSIGTDTVTLNSVDNKKLEDAKKALKSQFPDINITEVVISDENIEKDYVIKTEPAGGSEVAKDLKEINVYVSSGKEEKYVSVPNVVGMSKEDAQKKLNDEGLTNISFSEEYNSDYDAGKICAQSIQADVKIQTGKEIVLTVSKGEEISDYEYTITVSIPSSYNPFISQEDVDAGMEGVTSGQINLKVYDGETLIKNQPFSVDYSYFDNNGLEYTFTYTTNTDTKKKSDFKVEMYLNDEVKDCNPRITVSTPVKK